MESCLLILRSLLPVLRPAEQRVALAIMDSPDTIISSSITTLARRAMVSNATVVKLCKRVGYRGFKELKIGLAQDMPNYYPFAHHEISSRDKIVSVKDKIFAANMAALSDTLRTLDDGQLVEAVDCLADANRIDFYGLGASSTVARYAEMKFSSIGKVAVSSVDFHTQVTMASLLTSRDVAVGISQSGLTWEIVEATRVAKEAGARTICLTSFAQSDLYRYCEYRLLISSREPTILTTAIASQTALLSVIDSLFAGVANLVGHPSSSMAGGKERLMD